MLFPKPKTALDGFARAAVLAALVLLAGVRPGAASSSDALSFEFIAPETQSERGDASGAGWTVFLDGPIDAGAAQRLDAELEQRDIRSARVFLNSPGGLLLDGMELGRLIRRHGYSTYVGRQREPNASAALPGSCSSACVFAFLGGKYRFAPAQSRIGVHRFSSLSPADSDMDKVQLVAAAIVGYIKEMGVDVDLFERMSRAAKDRILILSETELRQLRVVNAGRQPARWSIEMSDGMLQLNGTQQTVSGAGAIALRCKDGLVLFRPTAEVGDDHAAAVDEVAIHSIKFGSRADALTEAIEPLRFQDGRASALFALDPDQVGRLRDSASVGYAAQLQDLSSFIDISVDTRGSAKTINEFLQNCRP